MASIRVKDIIPQSLKNIYHLFQAVLANVWYGFPSRRLKVIGVTGTNGKTTTVQMIAKILEEAGFKVAVASTINFKIGEQEWVNDTKFTTLSSWKLQKFLREAVRAGCSHAVIEISSHALDQNRAWGTNFSIAVVTNITREHLDYHGTIETYSLAKEKLFRIASRKYGSVSAVNLNMEFAEKFIEYPAKDKYGYFLENQSLKLKDQNQSLKLKIVKAENINLGLEKTTYQILDTKFQLNLPGEFNVENALAATCVGMSQEIALQKISEALSKIKGVPGRMEKIENVLGLEIIVDYAVTPDSLEKLYEHIVNFKKESSRIIAVLGACGERDRGKRPIMGDIVSRLADFVIVTNEDPYRENPVQIINEVFSGVVNHGVNSEIPNFQFPISNFQINTNNQISKNKSEGTNAYRILDRKEAIKKALQLAEPGDIVVVTGKGAEEIMAVRKKRIPWNDPKVIREILQELESAQNQ